MSFECFAKPWLIFTFLVFFARFAIFVKIDTLQRRICTKPMPIVCCAGFDIFVTLPYLPFLSKSPMLKGPLSTSHKTFRLIFGEILPYSPFLSKSLLLKGPLSTAHKTFRHIFGEILPYSPFLSKSLLLKGPLSTAH